MVKLLASVLVSDRRNQLSQLIAQVIELTEAEIQELSTLLAQEQ